MAKPGGIYLITDPFLGVTTEGYSSTCIHCQHVTDFPSKRVMFDYVDICRGCMKLICLECIGKPCLPFEKQAEQQEFEYKLRSRVHMQGWKCY